MNRFDKNFNNVDPETSRPFSSGHPDGAWIIAIIYGFVLFFALVAALYGIYQSIFGENINLMPLISALVVYGLLLPPIFLLFKRSKKALTWCGGLLVIFLVALISTFFSNKEAALPLLVLVCAQSYICFYILGLIKDKLLFN